MLQEYTVESLNKGHFGEVMLSFARSLSSLGEQKCIGTIKGNILGPTTVSL
jgi:hypothetical protein